MCFVLTKITFCVDTMVYMYKVAPEGCTHAEAYSSLKPRLSVQDFVSLLWWETVDGKWLRLGLLPWARSQREGWVRRGGCSLTRRPVVETPHLKRQQSKSFITAVMHTGTAGIQMMGSCQPLTRFVSREEICYVCVCVCTCVRVCVCAACECMCVCVCV